jgi:hypothetical protein
MVSAKFAMSSIMFHQKVRSIGTLILVYGLGREAIGRIAFGIMAIIRDIGIDIMDFTMSMVFIMGTVFVVIMGIILVVEVFVGAITVVGMAVIMVAGVMVVGMEVIDESALDKEVCRYLWL